MEYNVTTQLMTSLHPRGGLTTRWCAVAAAMAALTTATTIGNAAVLVALRRSRRAPAHYPLASLAAADLLVGLFVIPVAAARELFVFQLDRLICSCWKSLDIMCCTASILSLCCLGWERWSGITAPFARAKRAKRARLFAGLVWPVSLVVALPTIFIPSPKALVDEEKGCPDNTNLGYVFYCASLSFYLPAIVMVTLYARILCALSVPLQIRSHRGGLPGPDTGQGDKAPKPTLKRCVTVDVICTQEFQANAADASRRRVTYGQLEQLWEFLNENKDLATGFNKTSEAREFSKNMWVNITKNLNSHGDGATKDWKGWCKYWNDYKSKLKKLAAAIKTSYQQTGGGPSQIKKMTDIEKKFLQILGDDFGAGLLGMKVEPFEEDIQETESAPTVLESGGVSECIPTRCPVQLNESMSPEIKQPGPSTSVTPPPPASPPTLEHTTTGAPDSQSTLRRSQYRHRHMQRVPPITQDAARRTLIRISEKRANIEEQNGKTLKMLLREMKEIKDILRLRMPSPKGPHLNLPEGAKVDSCPTSPVKHPGAPCSIISRQQRATRTIIRLMALFLFCWTPFFIVLPLDALCDCVWDSIWQWCTWLGFTNSALNPLVYAAASPSVRRALQASLTSSARPDVPLTPSVRNR